MKICCFILTNLTLTILGGLPLSGPLQKISNKQNSVHNYAEVKTQDHATHKITWEHQQQQ